MGLSPGHETMKKS